MRHHCTVLLAYLTLAIGAFLLCWSPFGHDLEERFGLALLFKLRGPRPPPEGVVVVNVDDRSARLFGYPDEHGDWPRSLYARLLDTLIARGAAVVVFDIHFIEERDPVDDRVLADAIRRAGRVVLCEKLVRRPAAGSAAGTVELEERVPPAPLFAEAALALAPFPIPKIPVRVNRIWTFKTSAGDLPTLPVVALQARELNNYQDLRRVIDQVVPDRVSAVPQTVSVVTASIGLVEVMRRIRAILQTAGDRAGTAVSSLSDDDIVQRRVGSLLSVYRGSNSMYLDYYGPPATIPTYPVHDLLAGSPHADVFDERIREAIVFVGAARTTWSEQKDGFYTVFSREDGLDLSGVEIAATACANLLENRKVRPLPPFGGATLSAFLAGGCGLAGAVLPLSAAACALILAAAGYLGGALFLFTGTGWWLPTIVPLAIVFPGALLVAIVSTYVLARRERSRIEQALRLYLPGTVADQVSREPETVSVGGKTVYGVCLLSDAQNYTTLSERLAPSELSTHLNRYYERLYQAVGKHDGLVCNVIGDAMFAIWSSGGQPAVLKSKACRAAVEIQEAVLRFNRDHPEQTLPTRIGLHAGHLLMGNIGAAGHYEYAPVGDIANTVARIENLNKQFGTRILASAAALAEDEAVPSRLLGTFLLGGKKKPVTVHELFSLHDGDSNELTRCCRLFTAALELFRRRRWEQAATAFERCLALRPNDGPSRFYLQRCALYRLTPPPDDWQGVIHLAKF